VTDQLAGLVLAGGQSRRMSGTEKAFLPVAGVPMLTRIIDILAPQCAMIAIGANGDPARFAAYARPIIVDETPDAGPLAGLVSALDWFARHHPHIHDLISVPSDTPFLPDDLGLRLWAARAEAGARCACAMSDGRLHPVVGLWQVAMRTDLRAALVCGRTNFRAALKDEILAVAAWSNVPRDPFFNINTPVDLAQANTLL
jgi:molybdenum cofactor guanylyltransferase